MQRNPQGRRSEESDAELSDATWVLEPARPLTARREIGAVLTPLLHTVAKRCGLSATELATNSRRRPVVAARALLSQVAVHRYALSPTHVATALGVSRQTVLYGVAHACQLLALQHWSPDDLLP